MTTRRSVVSMGLIAVVVGAASLLLPLGMGVGSARADVTGLFEVKVGASPLDCREFLLLDPDTGGPLPLADQPCEDTPFRFDLQTRLDLDLAVSGLVFGVHTHAGTTGFEDVVLSAFNALSPFDLGGTLMFAQPYANAFLPTGEEIPLCLEDAPGSGRCPLLFVRHSFGIDDFSIGGAAFGAVAYLEDVNFPDYCLDFFIPGDLLASFFEREGCVPALKGVDVPSAYGPQSQSFGFGSLFTVEGQTPSGIAVQVETGICLEQLVRSMKNHIRPLRVNRDCVADVGPPKPPLLFSFEKLFIEDIWLTEHLTLDMAVLCGSLEGSAEVGIFFPCNLLSFWTITGGPLLDSITVEVRFEQILGPASLADIAVVARGGPLFLYLEIRPLTWTATTAFAQATFTVNPDANPAELRLRAWREPGLSWVEARLALRRGDLQLATTLRLDVDPVTQTLDFDRLELGMGTKAGVLEVGADFVLKEAQTVPEGALLAHGKLGLSVKF